MVALDLDATLKGLFQQVLHCLENVPKPQGENVPAITCELTVSISLRLFCELKAGMS
jgi:NCK-associated protein 1